ncbi:MAG TPA: nucleoside triphosphate pyrophosphohydrolase [Acidimicrobiia bacterium]
MTGRVTIVGLGPGSWEEAGAKVKAIALDPGRRVVVRTLSHLAAAELAELRQVETADGLYRLSETFDEVYERLSDLVVEAAKKGEDVVLALPGSPLVGERTTPLVRRKAAEAAVACEVVAGESFLDALWEVLEVDPLERGLQVLDGRDLPDPLNLTIPTVIAQVDVPVILAEVGTTLGRLLPEGTPVVVVRGLMGANQRVEAVPVEDLIRVEPGLDTTLFVEPAPVGWSGLVGTMRRLRVECPWDIRQTHQSLVGNLVEETYELVDAIAGLEDQRASSDLEEELGDVMLQVIFQSVIAEEEGRFRIDDVSEALRRKLVRRHPHVYGDAPAGTAEQVFARWSEIKAGEKRDQESIMDGLPRGIPALQRAEAVQLRAARVGFDWEAPGPVVAKVLEEVRELQQVLEEGRRVEVELGDLLFAVVNLGRHLGVDPEVALQRASRRFEGRFREVEAEIDVASATLAELDRVWEIVKARRRMSGPSPMT